MSFLKELFGKKFKDEPIEEQKKEVEKERQAFEKIVGVKPNSALREGCGMLKRGQVPFLIKKFP